MKKRIVSLFMIITILSAMLAIPASAKVYKKDIPDGMYIFYSKLGSNMVVDVDDASTKSGANVQLYKFNNTNAQKFEVKKSGDWYTIKAVCSGMALDVAGGSKESGANVQQYTPNGTDAQKWGFYDAGNGYYYIRSKVGDKALDVSGGKSANKTNIQVYNPNMTDSQKFKLVKTTKTQAAAASSEESKIISRINKMANGSSDSGIFKVGKKYTGPNASEQCKGFARTVHQRLFGYNVGSTHDKPNNYKINYSSSNTKYIGSVTSMASKSNSDIKSFFDKARAGDFVQIRRSHGGSHSAIFVSSDSKGITLFEANLDGKNTIYKKTYTWSQLKSKNTAMSVYTAKNYKLK